MPGCVVGEIKMTPGVAVDLSCSHRPHIPVFTSAECRWLSTGKIRDKFPRYEGICTSCKQQIILYASLEHFVVGGWNHA